MNGALHRHRGKWLWLLFGILAFSIGIFLRCWQLGSQILLDDEWHAVHELLRTDAHGIATHFGLADYSIPLTLYYRFLYLHGGLTEWGMHLPMLVAGVGLLLLGPWLLRRHADTPSLAIWVGLLAISPVLVYLSRTARPYAITDLLVFVAVLAFREWWPDGMGSRHWGVVYVVCAALAGWLHLITLPFTLWPFAFHGVLAVRDGLRARRWAPLLRLTVLGAATILLLCAALLPPLLNDWAALAGKAGSNAVSEQSAYRTVMMLFGVGGPWPFVAVLALFAAGVFSHWRREREFVTYLLSTIVAASLAIAISHPAWVQHPGTLARYLQPVLPFVLFFAAQGLAAALVRLNGAVQLSVVCAAWVGLYLAGPMPGYLYDPNQFMGHPYFQFDYDPSHNPYRTQLPQGPIPDFYRRLAALPPRSLTLIETPWSLRTDQDPQELYQRVHRQYVRIGLLEPVCGRPGYASYRPDDGIRLAMFVHLSTLLREAAPQGDLLVVHRRPWPPGGSLPLGWPADLNTCLQRIRARFGAPLLHSDAIDVFALSGKGRQAVRSASAKAG